MSSLFSLAPNGWSFFLLLPAFVSFWLVVETLRPKYGLLGKKLSILCLGLGWWSLTYALELASVHKEGMVFWLKAEYLVIPIIAPMMYLVIREFIGLPRLRLLLQIGIWVIPVGTILLQMTNEWHHFYYESVTMVADESRRWLSLEAGPWYILDAVYDCFLGLLASLHLLRRLPPRGDKAIRRQYWILVGAIVFPYVGFLLYRFGWFWVEDIDLTPFFFSISGVILAVGIFRFQLFDLVPIALERVFEGICDACLVFDLQERLLKANEAAKKRFGWEFAPLGALREEVFEGIPAFSQIGKLDDSGSIRIRVPTGKEDRLWVVSKSDLKGARGQVGGCLFVIRDDTEQMRLEQRLRSAIGEKDRLFSVIGHDMRGSLAGLESLSEILAETDNDLSSDEFRDLLHTMRDATAAASSFLEDLLLWARIQRGLYRSESERIVVAESVARVQSYLGAILSRKKIILEERIEPQLACEGDRKLLETVLRNLISNAAKFSPDDSIIRVSAESFKEDWIRIDVRDEGIGIPKSMMSSLGKPDSRNGRSGTHGESSSGIGLILVWEAVESMGGVIEVESEEGQGTLFRFEIPRKIARL